jgi:hypothetical protein
VAEKDAAEASLHEVIEAGNAWRRELTTANRDRLHAAMAVAMSYGFSPHAVAEAASVDGRGFTPIKVRLIVEDWEARATRPQRD